jgi:methylisocitrate lyase
MINSNTSAGAKRAHLRHLLGGNKIVRLPGAPNALFAKLIERKGFEGVYISGAVMANTLGIPDIGLTTLTEITQSAKYISNATNLPTIIDADTGFGETLNVVRTIVELEAAGVAGCHIEDQQNPKRCGHLDNKQLIDTNAVCQKIKAAAQAKTDENFIIFARTDARASEGLEKAIERSKAYIDAGAEGIFAEALADESEFEKFRAAIDVPIIANMTEFGKTKLLSAATLENIGIDIVIYPVTLQRIIMNAASKALDSIHLEGSQLSIIQDMQTRADLYDLIQYEAYNEFDNSIFNFKL